MSKQTLFRKSYHMPICEGRMYDETSETVTLGYVDPRLRVRALIDQGRRNELIRKGEYEQFEEDQDYDDNLEVNPTSRKSFNFEDAHEEIRARESRIKERLNEENQIRERYQTWVDQQKNNETNMHSVDSSELHTPDNKSNLSKRHSGSRTQHPEKLEENLQNG